MTRLLRSSKFMTAAADVLISLILFFAGKYAAPSAAEDITYVIVALQPVFAMVIAGIAYEDGQAKRALAPMLPPAGTDSDKSS